MSGEHAHEAGVALWGAGGVSHPSHPLRVSHVEWVLHGFWEGCDACARHSGMCGVRVCPPWGSPHSCGPRGGVCRGAGTLRNGAVTRTSGGDTEPAPRGAAELRFPTKRGSTDCTNLSILVVRGRLRQWHSAPLQPRSCCWPGQGCQGHRAAGARQDAARPGCHAAGAAQLEMQHIPSAAVQLCRTHPALSPAVLRAVPCPLHPARTRRMERVGGSSRMAARHPGDLWLSTGSDPSWEVQDRIQPGALCSSAPSLPGIPFSQRFPAVPGCLTQRPQPDTHALRVKAERKQTSFSGWFLSRGEKQH